MRVPRVQHVGMACCGERSKRSCCCHRRALDIAAGAHAHDLQGILACSKILTHKVHVLGDVSMMIEAPLCLELP